MMTDASEAPPAGAWRVLRGVLLGQCAALAMALTGVFTTLLVQRRASVPILQSLCAYVLITAVFLPAHVWRCALLQRRRWRATEADAVNAPPAGAPAEPLWAFARWPRPLHFPLWRYAVIAVFDVEANVLVVLAYQYTDLTSAQLLDCFTIPVVMALSRVAFRRRPSRRQLAGVVIAILGLALLVVLDAYHRTRTGGAAAAPNPLLGDMLCLCASVLYGCSNVACESLLKSQPAPSPHVSAVADGGDDDDEAVADEDGSTEELGLAAAVDGVRRAGAAGAAALPSSSEALPTSELLLAARTVGRSSPVDLAVEYLAFMPLCATLLAACQLFATSYADVAAISWTAETAACQLAFAVDMTLIYAMMPALFLLTSATFANLSLLTADIFAVVMNVLVFGVHPRGDFFIAFAVIMGGVLVYDGHAVDAVKRRCRPAQADAPGMPA
jgi:solute carrier family 35 protein F1/2